MISRQRHGQRVRLDSPSKTIGYQIGQDFSFTGQIHIRIDHEFFDRFAEVVRFLHFVLSQFRGGERTVNN